MREGGKQGSSEQNKAKLGEGENEEEGRIEGKRRRDWVGEGGEGGRVWQNRFLIEKYFLCGLPHHLFTNFTHLLCIHSRCPCENNTLVLHMSSKQQRITFTTLFALSKGKFTNSEFYKSEYIFGSCPSEVCYYFVHLKRTTYTIL